MAAVALGVMVCLFGRSPALTLDPQQPFRSDVVDHWSVEQGLPQITVLAMAEDRAGFLWSNTQAAVARFDGTRFVTCDRTATGIDTSMLAAVWAGPHGGVWFGGTHGLLHERHGHFTALGGAAVNAIIDAQINDSYGHAVGDSVLRELGPAGCLNSLAAAG